eukprot:CAMPEP_0197897682 /NCGR_PEP_ID=MMETSP1439-20131203/42314_1 /TAXON_ID=66791 /ORGANISM="Gonyaulax spinifera, Strain CCMP409" /LENGTH=316 /DNA_ID=CAMNT_0043518325 /DNA_START=72 /DNA_END=1019 /DNA_ORIENTATION=+
MTGACRLGFLCWAAAFCAPSAGSVEEPRRVSDGAALIQSGLQPRSGDSSSPGLHAAYARRGVQKFGEYLQRLEKTLEIERKAVQGVKDYISKLRSELGKHGTFLSETAGFMPAGKMDTIDVEVAASLLQLFRDAGFDKAVHTSVQDLGNAMTAFALRTEKRVTDLVVSSANATEKDMAPLIRGFFETEQHIVMGLIERIADDVRKLLVALPEEFSFIPGFLDPVLTRLVNETGKVVEERTKVIMNSNGAQFCGSMDEAIVNDVIPLVNQTLSVVPGLEGFAETHLPEVTPEVKKVIVDFATISGSVPALQKEIGIW